MAGWLFDEDGKKGEEAVFIFFVLVPEAQDPGQDVVRW